MKQLFILSICIITAFEALAARISEEKASQKAQEFASGKIIKSTATSKGLKRTNGIPSSKNFYVFNIGEDEGFVIISGDDRTRSVLGYSDKGTFEMDKVPSNMRWLLDGYDTAIGSLNNGEGASSVKPTRVNSTSEKVEIEPLISTKWGQGAPYNDKCPEFNGVRCVTGCVATATAQILNYHKWPTSETTAIEAYTTFENKIEMPELPSRVFNWDNMDDNEISDLMLYCGQAVKMNYGPNESATSSDRIPILLTENFHYGKSALYIERKQYTNEEWIGLLIDQLKNGLPIPYTGQGSTGSHAFILDGYKDGLFHVNWGWDGQLNGYFLLDELNPNIATSYSLFQTMVAYASPPVSVENATRSKIVIQSLDCSQKKIDRATNTPVQVKAILGCNLSTNAIVQIGFALVDENGAINLLAEDSYYFRVTDDAVKADEDLYITDDIQNGHYRLIAVNRMNDSEEWLPDSKSFANYIDVNVAENEILLEVINKSVDGREKVVYGNQTIDGLTYYLVKEYGSMRAYLIPPAESIEYSGDLYIPDYVEYGTNVFKVYEEEGSAFSSNSNITSISSPISLKISHCSNLESLEFREGVLKSKIIQDCPKLTTISFPSTCRIIESIENCTDLTEVHIHNLYPTEIRGDENGEIWKSESLPSLANIYLHGDEPPLFSSDDATDNKDLIIHVPVGLKESYEACGMEGWNLEDDLEHIANNVKWDECGYDEDCNDGLLAVVGTNDAEFAIMISKDDSKNYKGNKIVAIEYFTSPYAYVDNYSKNVEYVFITEPEHDYVFKQESTTIRGAWTRVMLKEPYEINGNDIFLGVGRNGKLNMYWANYDTKSDGFWYRSMGDDLSEDPGVWYHNAGIPEWNFPLPIRAIIEGDNLPSDIAILDAEYIVDEEKPLSVGGEISMKIRNRSPKLVKNLEFDLGYDGKQNENVATTTALPANHIATINVRPKDLKFNTHFIELKAALIDGLPDAVESNSKETFTLLSSEVDHYPRVSVLEESTSRLDGSDSNGIAIKEFMKTNYPDNLIALSLHKDSDMKVNDGSYDEFIKGASDYYPFNVNRKGWQFRLPFDINSEQIKGEAMIKSEALYSKDGRVNILSNSAFIENHDENDMFDIVYVLVEDKVGPFEQTNFLSGNSQYSNTYASWWVEQPQNVMYEFDDVARTVHYISEEDGLFPDEIIKDEVYESSYCMKVPSYVQNCDNLRLVTLLIDKVTGEILNAHRTEIFGIIPDLSIDTGDSNGSGEVNIADAVNIANFVVGKEVEMFHYTASDVNNDGNMSFADASATVSIILNQAVESISNALKAATIAQKSNGDALNADYEPLTDSSQRTILLKLDNTLDYVALQGDIALPEGMEIENVKIGKRAENTHKLAVKRLDEHAVRFILFDLYNRHFGDNKDAMLEIEVRDASDSGMIKLNNIIASDSNAHEYILFSNSEVSAVDGIEVSEIKPEIEISNTLKAIEIKNAKSKTITVYTVDGASLYTLTADSDYERVEMSSGLYIVKVNNVTKKIMIK